MVVVSTMRTKQSGFSYLALLMIMSITSIGMAAVGAIWSVEAQRQKEKELHFVGNAYANAIHSYYQSEPDAKRYPKSVQELIEDRRGIKVKRHLRKAYPDPMTRSGEWTFVKQGDSIIGVRSQSPQKIMNKQLFALGDESQSYADILFAHAEMQQTDNTQASANSNNANNDPVIKQTTSQQAEQTPDKPTAPYNKNNTSNSGQSRLQEIRDKYNAWIEKELNRMRDAIKSK